MSAPEQSVLDELTTVKDQVEWLLTKYPATRNSDAYLTLLYLKFIAKWPIPFIEWEKVNDANITSVRRLREVIQNDEQRLLPTDPAILGARRARSEAYRRAIKQV